MNYLIRFAIFFALPSALLADTNWPEFQGPRANNHSDSTDLPTNWSETENVKWKADIHGRGWSSPVIWGNQIWMCTATEDGKDMSALCIALDSGKTIYDLALFHNAEPRFCHLMNSYASCTPAIEEGRVYLHFGSYGTACVDTATGKTLWARRDLPCNHWRGPGSSPILFEDTLIIHYDGYDHQYIVSLSKTTGETVWKKDRNIDFQTDNGDMKKAYCTPLLIEVAGTLQLVSPAAKATIAYNPTNGDEIWKVRYDQHSATARPIFDGKRLYLNTGFGKAELHAVDPNGKGDITDTHVLWRATKSIPSKPSELLIDGLLYMVHDSGVAQCLDAENGEEIWTERLGGKYSASPLFADGKIYFFSHEGKTIVIAPGREFKKLAENELPDGFMASPAVSGKSLIVRTKTALYRIEK